MRIIKQQTTLPVSDLVSELVSTSPSIRRHGALFPSTLRCIVAGPSGCGKTNLLLSLITSPNGLRFENVYIFAKSLYQPLYKFLHLVMEGLKGLRYFQFDAREHVVSPDEVLPNSIMIFDDVSTEHQDVIRAYFSMGRHKYCDSFYLCQTYSRVPKQLIRDNANFLVLFRQDDLNLKHVYEDHVNSDMSFQAFKEMCSHCWSSQRYGFLVIDKESDLCQGRYRMGFDHYIHI